MSRELLCSGDMHLGRRPSRLPASLENLGVVPGELTPIAAWARVVEVALERRPLALLLAGDVVESENAWFEAFGPLEQGVRRLVEAGIEVYAVAGNHDGVALPRLARSIPGFHLLGEGGRWEIRGVGEGGSGGSRFRIAGWSFPARRFPGDPLEGFPPLGKQGVAGPEGGPLIGLLHCDLGAASSPYAPVQRSRLEALPVAAWLLGHLHTPTIADGARPIGYLGSMVGLDPTETGAHGIWSLGLGESGVLELESIPLAPLRWERLELDVSRIGDAEEEIEGELIDLLRAAAVAAAAGGEAPRALGCRISLVGRSEGWRWLAEKAANRRWAELTLREGRTAVFVEGVESRVRPALDLEELAARRDPPALLARELIRLEEGAGIDGELREALLGEYRAALRTSGLGGLVEQAPADDLLAEALREAGTEALDALLRQREVERG